MTLEGKPNGQICPLGATPAVVESFWKEKTIQKQEQTMFVTIQANDDEYLDEGSGTRDAEEGKDYRNTQYPQNKHSY